MNNGLAEDRSSLPESLHLLAAIVAARVSNIARLLQVLARDPVAIIGVRPYKLHAFKLPLESAVP
jgi:hypothetical protein